MKSKQTAWREVLGGYRADVDTLIDLGELTPNGNIQLPDGRWTSDLKLKGSHRFLPHHNDKQEVTHKTATIDGVEYKIDYK